MPSTMLPFIQEINILWEPVYPYLARHIVEIYGRKDGHILEVGPFCGVIFDLAKQYMGESFSIASFPAGMSDFYDGEIRKRSMKGFISIVETTPSLVGIGNETIDLLVFRGALFFPSLFKVDHQAIWRVLRPGGVAFVGGGFGKYTPTEVIHSIGERSHKLNLLIGKTEVNTDKIRHDLDTITIPGTARVITEGGLWIIINKGEGSNA